MVIVPHDGLRFALTYWAQRVLMLPVVWLVFRYLNRVRVVGLEHLDEVGPGPVILAPNHVSAWDSWVGCLWPLSSRRRYVERDSYCCVLAAPENVPTLPLKALTGVLGAIPVDRERGVEQHSMQDLLRLMRARGRRVVVTVYPEGTRSRDGRLRKKGKAGIGWLAHQTGATVVPVFHRGAERMPGVGMALTLRIGRPLRFDELAQAPAAPETWRRITERIMDSLRALEADADRAEGRGRPRPAVRRLLRPAA